MSSSKKERMTFTPSNFKNSYYRPYYFGHDSDESMSFKCSKCKRAFTCKKGDLKLSNGVKGPVEKLIYGYVCPHCGHLDNISYSDIRLFE